MTKLNIGLISLGTLTTIIAGGFMTSRYTKRDKSSLEKLKEAKDKFNQQREKEIEIPQIKSPETGVESKILIERTETPDISQAGSGLNKSFQRK